MRNFLDTIFKSIWAPGFYSSVPSQNTSAVFKYVLKLLFLIAFISSAVIFAVVTPFSKNFNFKVADFIKNKYPSDLEISVNNGILSTNTSRVYVLDFPKEIFGDMAYQIKRETGLSSLLVLDTTSDLEDLLKIEKGNSLIFLTKDNAIFKDAQNSKMTVQSLKKFPNVLINKQIVDGYSQDIKRSFAPFMIIMGVLGLILLFCASVLKYFFTALFAGLIIWFISRVSKNNEKYWLCFRYALYGMTLPILLGFVFFTLAMPMQMHVVSGALLSALVVIANKRSKKVV